MPAKQPPTWTNDKRKLGDLKKWPDNPRYSTKDDAAAIVESYEDFGQTHLLLISPDNELYDGHQRLDSWLAKYGADFVVDVRVSSYRLSDRQRRKLVADLHIKATGQWNWDVLAGWGDDLKDWGFDKNTLKEWNNDANNLKEMLAASDGDGAGNDAEPQTDKAAELQEKWQTATGQLWAIGEHRLLCGDSTRRDDAERVMGGERARIVFTSPPYADQREYEIGKFDWLALMNGVSDCLFSAIGNPADVLVNLGMSHKDGRVNFYWNDWLKHCEDLGHPLYGWYVWDKGEGFPGDWNGRLGPAHEFVFHFSVGRASANKWIETAGRKENRDGGRFRASDGSKKKEYSPDKFGQPRKIPDSVIRINREKAAYMIAGDHPAIFPVDFPSFGLQTWSAPGDVAFEPFAGSGTTLVACQNLGRKCRAIEISPAYVAVVLERMITAFPGIDIHLIE